jgi:hypothetical protein
MITCMRIFYILYLELTAHVDTAQGYIHADSKIHTVLQLTYFTRHIYLRFMDPCIMILFLRIDQQDASV